ncbi:hypothetical protein ACCP09_14750 [Amycolatopsis sp. 3B14]
MTKLDDQITFDFTGSSEQTDGFVNCSFGAPAGDVTAHTIRPIVRRRASASRAAPKVRSVASPKLAETNVFAGQKPAAWCHAGGEALAVGLSKRTV